MCPGSSQKPGLGLWDRSWHPASPTSPRWFHEPHRCPEAMGMGTLGHLGHGCYRTQRKGGQSLLAPCKAAPMPARCASLSHTGHRPLCPAVPSWAVLSAHQPWTQHRRAVGWQVEGAEAPTLLISNSATYPCLCPRLLLGSALPGRHYGADKIMEMPAQSGLPWPASPS